MAIIDNSTNIRKLPWDALPEPSYRYIYELFEKVFLSEFTLSIDKTRRSVIDYVTAVRGNTNMHMANDNSLMAAWDEMSDLDDLQDFILKITTTLRFYIGYDAWADLLENVANSLGLFGPHKGVNKTLTDPAFSASVLAYDNAIAILQSSPWVLTIYLITLMEPSIIAKLGAIIGRGDEALQEDDLKKPRGSYGINTENNG